MERKDFFKAAFFGIAACFLPTIMKVEKTFAHPDIEPYRRLYNLERIRNKKHNAIERQDWEAAFEYRQQEKKLLGIVDKSYSLEEEMEIKRMVDKFKLMRNKLRGKDLRYLKNPENYTEIYTSTAKNNL